MTEVCGVGSLFEDLTGTPATGVECVPLLLLPLSLGLAEIAPPIAYESADELVIDMPIYAEVTMEAWIGPEGTIIGSPTPIDDDVDSYLTEDGDVLTQEGDNDNLLLEDA